VIRTAKGWSRDRWTEYIRKEVAKGSYSAIVYIDGSTVYAEDAEGKTIAQGEAGVNDASVIQSAIDALPSGEGKILIAEGTYAISSKISINNNDIVIEGVGDSTILKMTDNTVEANYGIFEISANKITICNMKFDGNRTNQGTYDKTPHLIGGAGNNLRFKRLYIHDTMGDGIELLNSENVWIINCRFYNVKEHSIHLNGVTIAHVIGNYIKDENIAAIVNDHGGSDMVIIANNIIDNENTTAAGIQLAGDSGIKGDTVIMGNIIKYGRYGIFVLDGYTNIKIIGNTIINQTRYAVLVGSDKCTVIGNTIIAGSYTSVYVPVYVSGTYNLIKDNYIRHYEGSVPYLIKEVTGADYNIIDGNDLHDGVVSTSIINKVGTNTKIKNNIGYVTENSGTATFSGDGTTTAFTFAHGLATTPTHVEISPKSDDATGDWKWSADATNITITFMTAPASGTDNVVFSWRAEV